MWVSGEAEYFFRDDWTGQIRLKWQEKFGCARTHRKSFESKTEYSEFPVLAQSGRSDSNNFS
jgi:hypothetical protein